MATAKILEIIQLLKEHDLGSIEVSIQDQLSIKVHARSESTGQALTDHGSETPKPIDSNPLPPKVDAPQKDTPTPKLTQQRNNEPIDFVIQSPMVGTVYLAASPDAQPFAQVGQRVKKGDTLCLIEAMKTYNHILAEYDGTIEAVLIENEKTVECGTPLFTISPA